MSHKMHSLSCIIFLLKNLPWFLTGVIAPFFLQSTSSSVTAANDDDGINTFVIFAWPCLKVDGDTGKEEDDDDDALNADGEIGRDPDAGKNGGLGNGKLNGDDDWLASKETDLEFDSDGLNKLSLKSSVKGGGDFDLVESKEIEVEEGNDGLNKLSLNSSVTDDDDFDLVESKEVKVEEGSDGLNKLSLKSSERAFDLKERSCNSSFKLRTSNWSNIPTSELVKATFLGTG